MQSHARMWPIIKAEFHYNLRVIVVMIMFIIPAAFFYVRTSPSAGMSTMLLPLSAGVILQIFVVRSIEKRERLNVLLPTSIGQIAIMRVSLIFLPLLFFHVLYLVMHLAFRNKSSLWLHDTSDLVMFFGLILLGFSVYLILHDAFLSIFRNQKVAEFDILILIAMMALIFLGIPLAFATIWKNPSTGFLQKLCLLGGVLSLFPAVYGFRRRKSYLE